MSAGKVQERENAAETLGPFGVCPLPIFDHPQIVLGHGSGGKLSAELIEKVFVSRFRNSTLEKHGRPGCARNWRHAAGVYD